MDQHTNKNYHIITYGCQMNEHDSEKLAGMLEDMGYNKTDELEEADIILLNTCTIRENAELKVFGKVGSLKRLKRKNSDLIIGIGGCMMQVDEVVDKIYEKFSHVDLVFGTHNIHRLPELIKQIEDEKERVFEIWQEEDGLIPDVAVRRKGDFKAWVSIIQGCDNFCSYCIVPHVRGRERSRPPAEIISEIKKVVDKGVKEITLLGQNVNSYGKDMDQDMDFADLLYKINEIKGLKRIRFMTSHPRDFSEKLIKAISEYDKVCEHFHLPVQSGSSRVLNKMNRGYTRKEYLKLVNKIKEHIERPSITTDIIVGFPEETEEDFNETLSLVKKVKFDMAYTFAYSPREGTRAAEMEEQVAEDIKDDRLQRLMDIQNKISYENNKHFKGETVRVLVEGESKNNPKNFMGRSRRNKLVIFPKCKDCKGQIIKVKINEVNSWTLYGEIVDMG